ncbi:MAG: hypothetical protein ABI947_03310 [Chloroflexota bacterium]
MQTNRRWLVVTLFTLAITLGWVAAVLIHAGGDPKLFALIGTKFNEHDPAGSVGYDGQFSYYIATEGIAASPKLDIATYRYQRLLYPLLGGLLSFGQTGLAAWTLIAINVIALTATTGLLAIWLERYQMSPWYALVFASWVGCLLVIRMDLNELLCMSLGVAGLLLILDGQIRQMRLATLMLALSALTKDMGFVFIGAAMLYLWFSERRTALLVGIGASLPYVLLAILLQVTFAKSNIGIYQGPPLSIVPFAGYTMAKSTVELWLMVWWLIIPAVLLGGMAAFQLLVKRQVSLPTCLVLGAALWVIYLPGASAYDLIAAYRVAAPIVPAGVLFAGSLRQGRLLLGLTILWVPALLQVLLLPGFFF